MLLHKLVYLFTFPHFEHFFLNYFQRREAAHIHEGAGLSSGAQGSVSTSNAHRNADVVAEAVCLFVFVKDHIIPNIQIKEKEIKLRLI